MKETDEVKKLKLKVEKMDKTIRVLVNALSRAGIIEFVDTSKDKKKALKIHSVDELENE
ncbi:MAG: hypothetical protein WC002_06275 [Candidatus Muiribacteriota bacterium]|jgi:hypothetical protein